jgi:hypothetical protein
VRKKKVCSAEHVKEIFEWAGVSGGGDGKQASYSQSADQSDFHGETPEALVAL